MPLSPHFPSHLLIPLALFLMSTPSRAQPEIVAHRGYSAKAPENTLAAFQLAWQSGADACELDLRLTADDQLIVIHDATTQRTTGIDLVVATTSLDALRTLDAGTWKSPDFTGEKLPTLAEALATLPTDPTKRFFIEVKTDTEILPALTRELMPWQPRAAQLAVIAFDKAVTAAVKKAMPWLTVLQLSNARTKAEQPVSIPALIAHAIEHDLNGLNLSRDFPWSKTMVDQIHAASLTTAAWTVNDPEEAKRLATLGIHTLTTDDPTQMAAALTRQH